MLDQSQVEEWSRISTVPEPRQRLKGFWAGFITATLIGLAVAAGFAIGQYDPIEQSGYPLQTRGYQDSGDLGPGVTVHEQSSGYELEYRDRQSASLIFQLGIQGRVPVTITGFPGLIDTSPNHYGLLRRVRLHLTREQSVNQFESVSFPVHLAQGDTLIAKMDAEIANCEGSSSGTGTGFSGIEVNYRVLGFPRTMYVPLGGEVFIKSPPDSQCPYRGFVQTVARNQPIPFRTQTPECRSQEKVVRLKGEAPGPDGPRSPEVALAEFLEHRYPHLVDKPELFRGLPTPASDPDARTYIAGADGRTQASFRAEHKGIAWSIVSVPPARVFLRRTRHQDS